MPKRNKSETAAPSEKRRERAAAAVSALLDDIHQDNRLLEGDELVEAVYEIFQITRPLPPDTEPT